MNSKILKTWDEISEVLNMNKAQIDWLRDKKNIKVKGRSNKDKRKNLYDIVDFQNEIEKIKRIPYKELMEEILKLYRFYKKHEITLPKGLQGDWGEFFVMLNLINEFPHKTIIFLGGTTKDIDLTFETKKIQVKYYFNIENLEVYGFHIEMCPDIKSDFEKTCDYVILVQVYFTDSKELALDESKTCAYIFNKEDFKYFSTTGCWGGEKGKKTIWNIPDKLTKDQEQDVFQDKKYKDIRFYYTNEYKNLFKRSKNNWQKLVD